MCLAVYISSNRPLPESSWDEHAPAFYLESVKSSEPVLRQFRHQHVYYAGSHERCGCGFSKDGRDTEELERCQKNYRSLAALLEAAAKAGNALQVFTCWEGQQTAKPTTQCVVPVARILEPTFELQELSLLTVQGDA